MKTRNILDAAIVKSCFLFVAGPASAGILLPEPGTLSIFAVGIAAAYLIHRRNRRK